MDTPREIPKSPRGALEGGLFQVGINRESQATPSQSACGRAPTNDARIAGFASYRLKDQITADLPGSAVGSQ